MPSNANRKTSAAPARKPAPKAAKAAAKKGAAKKGSSARKAAQSKARTELLALLPELDEEGVAFLLEQARVHRYNMEVERLNAIADRAAEDDEAGASDRAPVASRSALRLERSKDGSTYHIVCGSVWKMFTAEEIASLVRIARSDDTEGERSRRIRSWFARERRDVLVDLGLDGPSIGLALDIARLLRKSFPPRS